MIAVTSLVKQFGALTAVDEVSLCQAGRNSRLPGTEWRWKDDHDQDDRPCSRRLPRGRGVVHDMAEEPELAKSSLGFIPDRPRRTRSSPRRSF